MDLPVWPRNKAALGCVGLSRWGSPVKFKWSKSVATQILACFFSKSSHWATTPLEEWKVVNSDWYVNLCLPQVLREVVQAPPTTWNPRLDVPPWQSERSHSGCHSRQPCHSWALFTRPGPVRPVFVSNHQSADSGNTVQESCNCSSLLRGRYFHYTSVNVVRCQGQVIWGDDQVDTRWERTHREVKLISFPVRLLRKLRL